MEVKELGSSGLKLPEIGLGAWQYSSGPGPLRRGIALGANLIDTAEAYSTERVVGEAVEGQREQVFIATKVSSRHLRYEDVLEAAERSLERLGTDCIDLYQIHSPNSSVPIVETMRAMEELVDKGKVRFIGVSNFSVSQLEEAQQALPKYAIVSNQVLYNLFDRQIEHSLFPYCQQSHITILAYSPLARGALTSKPLLRHRASMEVLGRIAEETGRTLAQVALNWCISKPNVIAIPKSNRVERVEENCQASGWRLTEDQIATLDRAFSQDH